ncbi:MAG: Peptidase M23 [Microgenomates group bacterium GW2011_GWC1_49_7]|nr:MAG: Peptidase M23 [Microgenomates group bacterium GW2011_GWC1_49_7]
MKRVHSNRVSSFFRNAFEHKLARKAVSASLTLLVMSFGLMSNLLASESQAADAALISQPENQLVTQTTLDKPLDGRLAQGFHGWHRGIDLLAPLGPPIQPISEGVVSEVSLGRLGWGNTIVVDHGNGLKSRYAHMKEVRVIEGDQISKDQALGTVGMTGWTTGPHLHLEIYQNGRAVDPAAILPAFDSPDYRIARGE